MKTIVSLIIMLFIGVSCFGQKKEFRRATRGNSIESYDNFLKKFPDDKRSAKAKNKKLELCNERGTELLQPEYEAGFISLGDFIDKCKESQYYDEIVSKLEDQTWDLYGNVSERKEKELIKNAYGQRKENRKQLIYFLGQYPNSKWKEKANARIEWLDWYDALQGDTKESIQEFLKAYPKSNYGHQADSLLLAFEKYALPRAIGKANLEKVRTLLPNKDSDSKSRALMYAVHGALHTYFDSRYDQYGNIQDLSIRTAKAPRESYIKIIEILLDNGADPIRYAFEGFGSVEVKNKIHADKLKKQVLAKGYGTVTSRIGGKSNMALIPYNTGGLSIKEIAIIHKAEDILSLLKESD